ncbi:hypothetical protein ACYOEI_39525, partial [Singulisphaera rosea]
MANQILQFKEFNPTELRISREFLQRKSLATRLGRPASHCTAGPAGNVRARVNGDQARLMESLRRGGGPTRRL